MSKIDPVKRVLLIIIIFLALFQFFIQISFLSEGSRFIVDHFTIDDTYYYLGTAWNLKIVGFTTFDGINRTNGVQQLWFIILYFLSFLAGTKTVFLFFALIICFIFNSLVYLFVWKISELSGQIYFSVLLGSLWFREVLSSHYFFSGMENSLHIFIFFWMVFEFLKLLKRIKGRAGFSLVPLSILLTLNVWTRIDSLLFSSVFLLFIIGYLICISEGALYFVTHYLKRIGVGVFIILSGVTLQVILYKLMGGSWFPVSALIKTEGVKFSLYKGLPGVFTEKISISFPGYSYPFPLVYLFFIISLLIFTIYLNLKKNNNLKHLPNFKIYSHSLFIFLFLFLIIVIKMDIMVFLLTVFLIATMIFVKSGTNISMKDLNFSLKVFFFAMLSSIVLYHLYISGSRIGYDKYFFWYRSPFIIFKLVVLSLIPFIVIRVIAFRNSRVFLPHIILVLSFAVFISGMLKLGSGFDFHPMLDAQYRAGKWIQKNIPKGSINASWNAGHIGYFSDRSVINLDGLINSYDYYSKKKNPNFNMRKYLIDHGVEYIADYCCVRKNGLLPFLTPVHFIQTQKGWNPITIWKLTF